MVVYESVPDGMDFSTQFDTFILAFCPDSDSWFATNKRFFFYEYPKEFLNEDQAIRFFKQHPEIFLGVEYKMGTYKPNFFKNGVYLENTSEFIVVKREESISAK